MDQAPIPRPAATVILLRSAARGRFAMEVLMLRRGSGARFMPGVWVFPGGAVDPADHAAASAGGLELEPDELAHRVCGARELGEEASIALEPAALRPWSRWVTPEVVPIRFDTRFYVAAAPPGAAPRPDRNEVDVARWISPEQALADHADDRFELSFPTLKHLEELAGFADATAVLAEGARRHIEAITPRVRGDRGDFEVLLPGDPGFADE
ncbi:MAG: NUDIX hydrolase [Actinomycetes bacterium]|nr:MAG: NUDIX hydrolase [Actinomycetes bacterium]